MTWPVVQESGVLFECRILHIMTFWPQMLYYCSPSLVCHVWETPQKGRIIEVSSTL